MKKFDKSETNALHSRPPLERMLRIHQALQSGKFPNASTLAREIEVATKTIHRDIEFMRDRLGLPVEYDSARIGYHYTEEVSAFPNIQITEGELLRSSWPKRRSSNIAARASRSRSSAPSGKWSSRCRHHFAQPADIGQTISFRTRAEPILNLEIFDTLARAAARRQQIELAYRKPGRKETEPRLVDPYHLANINGEWYLFAYDTRARTSAPSCPPACIREADGENLRAPAKVLARKTFARQLRRPLRRRRI